MIDLLHVSRQAHCTRVSYKDKTAPPSSKRPFIIPVFLPQVGCPHQCAFCNQRTISGLRRWDDDRATLSAAVDKFLTYRHSGHGITQLAFYGGNFLGLPMDRIRRYLDWATAYVRQGDVDSLRFSTRPDTISPASLALIRADPVRTIELGAQSMDNRVLIKSKRGHQAEDTIRAASQLNTAGYEVGLQIMTGLPGDTRERAIATVEAIVNLAPAFVRIYPTLVLAGSPLAAAYAAGHYRPPPLAESIHLLARMWLMLTAAGIRVVRMGLQDGPTLAASGNVLAGPYHPAFGEQVISRVFRSMAEAALNHSASPAGNAVLRVNPRRLSVMTGPRRRHLDRLQNKYRQYRLRVRADETQPINQLEVDNL